MLFISEKIGNKTYFGSSTSGLWKKDGGKVSLDMFQETLRIY